MKFLRYLMFATLMIGAVWGVIYVERQTDAVAQFKQALGLVEEKKARGISFAGNSLGSKKVKRDESLADMIVGFFKPEPVLKRQEPKPLSPLSSPAEIAAMMDAMAPNGDMDFGPAGDAPTAPAKTKRGSSLGSGGLGASAR